jgi:hypothetical protein
MFQPTPTPYALTLLSMTENIPELSILCCSVLRVLLPEPNLEISDWIKNLSAQDPFAQVVIIDISHTSTYLSAICTNILEYD